MSRHQEIKALNAQGNLYYIYHRDKWLPCNYPCFTQQRLSYGTLLIARTAIPQDCCEEIAISNAI